MSISPDIALALEEEEMLRAGLALGAGARPGAPENAHGALVASAGAENINITQRMISACLGSFITSLVVTPFDVVRIRMQQQEIMPASCCESAARAIPAAAAAPLKSSAPELFWVSQHYCNSAQNCAKINSTLEGFISISRQEGPQTLWRGLSLTLLMAIPSNIIYFTGYEYIRDRSPISDHFLNPLVCGALARSMAATCIAPIELIKTRLQAIPTDTNSPQMLSTLLRDLVLVVRTRGVRTLFTGLQITLWRDVPFLGIYWSCYEFCKHHMGLALGADFDLAKNDELRVFATSFLSGLILGSIAALCTHPFDVGKTRLQITSDKVPTGVARPSMFASLVSIYRREGMRALYSGIWPRVLKVAPSCAIMISSYEIGKKFFKKENGRSDK
jgi:solute carrier family 25 protein 39/40